MPTIDSGFALVISGVIGGVSTVGILRFFPKFISELALRGIDQKNALHLERVKNELQYVTAVQLERLRAEFESSSASFKTSAEFLATTQGELRIKMINAVEQLWGMVLAANHEFRDLIYVETILTAAEIDVRFKRKDWSKFPTIDEYNSYDAPMQKLRLSAHDRDRHRLFVSERLWTVLAVHTAVLGRLAYLYYQSHREGGYRDWRRDKLFLKTLEGFLPADELERVIESPFQGPSIILQQIEAMFLREALGIMSGARTFGDTIAEMGSAVLQEKERMAMAAMSPSPQ